MRKTGPLPSPIPENWHPLIEGYQQSLLAIGRPATTIATRRSHIARMARALTPNPADVTSDSLMKWFASQTQWQRETRRGYRNSAASFFTWAHTSGHLPTNPATTLPTIPPAPPSPKPAPARVYREAMLAAAPRVMLMLQLATEVGLRRGEVAQVHTNDVIGSFAGYQLVVHGKGDKERILPITDDLAAAILEGEAGHSPGPGARTSGWLFPGDDAGHLSPRWVGKLCAKTMPGVWTMHKLRHRCATEAYRGTRNLRAVQKLLGHASVATTERYTAVDDDEVRAAMMAAARAS